MSGSLALLGGPATVTYPMPPYPVFDHEEVNAAVRVVMSRFLSDCGRGIYIAEMEDAFSQYFGANYALSCASGTAAIHAALFAVGVTPGSEVLVANHNWISPIMSVFHAAAIPVLCDVKADTFSIDPAEIKRKATRNTRAVIATHLWGLPADMDGVCAAAKELGLPVIEDVSHAHGGKYKGRYFGTIGDIGCFSLQGSKAIVGGEAGFLLTNSDRLYQRAMAPGHHVARLSAEMMLDEMKPFMAAGGMYTYRCSTVAAAIATAQLKKLPVLNAARQANFDRLAEKLSDIPFITFPTIDESSVRGWYGTPAFFDAEKAHGVSRDLFVRACQAEGVPMGGEGYTDYSQIPMLQDMDLLGSMFVIKHPGGAEFKPVKQGELPNNDRIRTRMMMFTIMAVEVPRLIDEISAAIHKVADQLDVLATAEIPA